MRLYSYKCNISNLCLKQSIATYNLKLIHVINLTIATYEIISDKCTNSYMDERETIGSG